MTYIIHSIDKLEDLINDRKYIDNLTISYCDKNINYLLQNLTDLTYLRFGQCYNQPTDLSKLSNLLHLQFEANYDQLTDLSMLPNLQHLIFGTHYNQELILPNFSNLKYLKFGYNFHQHIDFSKLGNLEDLIFIGGWLPMSQKIPSLSDLQNLKSVSINLHMYDVQKFKLSRYY